MCRSFDQSRRFGSLAIAARDEHQQIQALIAPIRVETFLPVAPSLTARAIMYGKPLCEPTDQSIAAMRFLLQHHASTAKRSVLLTEVRSVNSAVNQCPMLAEEGYLPKRFGNFVVNLAATQDELWRRVGKQMRGNISRSTRRGVTINTGSSSALARRAHTIIQRTLRRSMIPFPGIDLFENVRANLGETLQVRVATFEGEE
jgi:serine/alanine adding enzyme